MSAIIILGYKIILKTSIIRLDESAQTFPAVQG